MTKAIYKFFVDCGRMGDLEGIFVSEVSELESLIGKEIYFGEVLGKHSEIVFELEKEHIEEMSRDQDFITKVEEIIGGGTISGINPIDYYNED